MSHFVLRLAHCRGEELRRWFLAHEGELFAARFREEPYKVRVLPFASTLASHRATEAFGLLFRGLLFAVLNKAGLPYEPLPAAAADPSRSAHQGDPEAAAAAEALQARLRDVALSRGDRDAALAIVSGKMGFYEANILSFLFCMSCEAKLMAMCQSCD